MKTEINDSNCTILGVKSKTTERPNLFAERQSCYGYSHIEYAVSIKEENCETNTEIAPSDINIELGIGDDNDMNSCCNTQLDKQDNARENGIQTSIDTKVHISEGNYKCEICSKYFIKKKYLGLHLKMHTSERNYKCEICEKGFKTKQYMLRHMEAHTGERNHKCEICSKRFTTKSNLAMHVKKHTVERNYKCDLCSKRFTTKDYLAKHVKSHGGERNYKCDICKKCSTTKENLVKHIKTHTEKRTYECDICNNCFSTRRYMLQHVKLHTGEQNYKCKICTKSFITSQQLSRHIRMHTMEGNFKCEICDQHFSKKKVFLAHMKTHVEECNEEKSLENFPCFVIAATEEVSEINKKFIKEETVDLRMKDNDTTSKTPTLTNQSCIGTTKKQDESKSLEIVKLCQTLHNEIIIKEEHITNTL